MIAEITQSEDIALQLSISTHTVNNHLKNIFEKTKSKSKTDVLAKFYGYATQSIIKAQNPSTLQRPLQILFMATNPSQGTEVAVELQKLGAQAVWSTSLNVEGGALPLNVDWVVKPFKTKNDLDIDDLVGLRRSHNLCIQLRSKLDHTSPESKHDSLVPELFALGCVGVLDAELSASTLAFEIAKTIHEFSNISLGAVPDAQEAHVKPSHQMGPIIIEQEFLGSHGFYLNLNDLGKNKLSWQVKDKVSLSLSLPFFFEEPIHLRAQVVWKRAGNDLGRPPGMGFWIQHFETSEDRRRYLQAAFECKALWAIPPATDQFEIANDGRKHVRMPTGA